MARRSRGWLVFAAAGVVTALVWARPWRPSHASYAEARAVVDRRCVDCHSSHPTSRAFPFAPKGVMLDTGTEMQAYAQRIKTRVVIERTMPLANLTEITDQERELLRAWVDDGAPIPDRIP